MGQAALFFQVQVRPRGILYIFLEPYNHAHIPRLEKLLYLELSRSSGGLLKPLPDPGVTCYVAVSEVKWTTFHGYIFNGHSPTDAIARSGITAM